MLQNGLRIFFKETDLYDDEILVKGRRWGGLSEFQDFKMFGLVILILSHLKCRVKKLRKTHKMHCKMQ